MGGSRSAASDPTVLDSNLDDYGAAYPGFLILNPKLSKGLHARQIVDLRP